MKIDAIILSNTADLHRYALTCRTINTLKQSDKLNEVDVYIVESQDTDSIHKNGFIYTGCTTIYPRQPFGYNKFLNIGIKHTTSEWILVCNNDLLFTDNWLLEAKRIIELNPDIKSFSPRCPDWHLHKNLPSVSLVEGYTVPVQIVGWCILMHRSLIDQYHLFDEQFDFWYQDNDYAMVLQTNNERHGLMVNSNVYHVESASHDLISDRHKELTIGQQQKFYNKWRG